MQHCNNERKFDCLATCSQGELDMYHCENQGRWNEYLRRQTAMAQHVQTLINEDLQQGLEPQLSCTEIRDAYSQREWMAILVRRI